MAQTAGWIAEEAEAAKIYRWLEDVAVRYKTGKASLLRGPDLRSAQALLATRQPQEAWAQRYDAHFHDVAQLIADSKRRRWRLFLAG